MGYAHLGGTGDSYACPVHTLVQYSGGAKKGQKTGYALNVWPAVGYNIPPSALLKFAGYT